MSRVIVEYRFEGQAGWNVLIGDEGDTFEQLEAFLKKRFDTPVAEVRERSGGKQEHDMD